MLNSPYERLGSGGAPPSSGCAALKNEAFLVAEDVALRLRCSLRTVHELTRLGEIPHRRLAGRRRCLFREDELRAWEDGAPLEIVELANGGRIVRPIHVESYSSGTRTGKDPGRVRDSAASGD